MSEPSMDREDVRSLWPILTAEQRISAFRDLSQLEATEFFLELSTTDQAGLLQRVPEGERRLWFRLLKPDDAVDLLQSLEDEALQKPLLATLDESTRHEVVALLAYEEDAAGGLMSPRFARLRPEMSVGEAINYLRRQARENVETIYYGYVLSAEQRLLGVVSFRDLCSASDPTALTEIMHKNLVTARDDMNQEELAQLFARYDMSVLPVLSAEGRMQGIVTVDDIVDVVQQEATEDIQKLGGMEALDTPYLQTTLPAMVKKRAGWLSALFLGEMLTASAMSHFEEDIARAVVLALFVPLIISSGGNSGSQATTLIIRAMALGEVKIRDWWHIARRELVAGLGLGLILAALGTARILLWQGLFHAYGDHPFQVALTVALSLIGVVTWGTLAGSMLPFLIRRLGFDPASASAPFVATLVDVSGLVIYFSVAQVVLSGTLL